jgi:hypothetical protein
VDRSLRIRVEEEGESLVAILRAGERERPFARRLLVVIGS